MAADDGVRRAGERLWPLVVRQLSQPASRQPLTESVTVAVPLGIVIGVALTFGLAESLGQPGSGR
jgi:hypothetical protein